MVLLEHQTGGVRERALALFAGKAQRAIGLRGEVVILITSSRQVQEMNHLYRKKNEPTDVLSFPSQNPKLVGDIAISAEIAASNAAEMGHWAETELRILILHGLLHLAGYDHETDTGEMHAQESKLRRQFGLPVGLIERTHGEGIEKPLKARQRGKGRMSNSAAQPQPTLSKPLTPAKKQGRRR